MLDETIITETPPLSCCYGRRGQQVCIPVTGSRAVRVLHGVINVTPAGRAVEPAEFIQLCCSNRS